ncbi:hypothetical protein MBLNU230_g3861t1 [Neophaeotheca triangularis]
MADTPATAALQQSATAANLHIDQHTRSTEQPHFLADHIPNYPLEQIDSSRGPANAQNTEPPALNTQHGPFENVQQVIASPDSTASIRYTKSGRVSKATKGQRIHRCEVCDKTYTRAEHLRRHQQNHKPGAFPCEMPGCTRSFFREDLLNRHRARHNDPNNQPSRRNSVGSHSSPTESDKGVPPLHPVLQQQQPQQSLAGALDPRITEDAPTSAPIAEQQVPTGDPSIKKEKSPHHQLLQATKPPAAAMHSDSSKASELVYHGSLWEQNSNEPTVAYESPAY